MNQSDARDKSDVRDCFLKKNLNINLYINPSHDMKLLKIGVTGKVGCLAPTKIGLIYNNSKILFYLKMY